MDEVRVRDELRELDSLVGLAVVKAEVARIVTRLVDEQRYRAQGASILPARRHLVFSGPAGVGKQKVAGTFGQICARLGALAKGHLVCLDQSDFGTVGSRDNILLMIDRCWAALDGILYVKNEAFLAAGILRSTGDLRIDPVDILIEFMARHRGRIIVILDARPNQFDYISFHSELARLFNETIHFAPYEPFELIQILNVKARQYGLELPDDLGCELFPWIISNVERYDWRNAREMVDLLGRAIAVRRQRVVQHRCATLGSLDRHDFRTALAAMHVEPSLDFGEASEIRAAQPSKLL